MVVPIVLRKRHTLVGVDLIPLMKRIRDADQDDYKGLASMTSENPTEDLTMDQLAKNFRQLSGRSIDDVLQLSNREINIANSRLALSLAIVYANEVGFPAGQKLVEPVSILRVDV